ncbi:hypothetical protein PybrP1_000135 [[Pythium] brassicae (nom. inval.)]|nr:hypothetical protein PybrP1_000135 [[Pythium] brassicae (nom. inval.)]
MGQAASSSSPPASSPPPTPSDAQAERALQQMARRPPLRCVFYYESLARGSELQLPLLYAKRDAQEPGTCLADLERWLRDEFRVPPGASVFAVVPAGELYSPPYPLVMLNTVAARLQQRFDDARVPVLHLALVVRSMARLHEPMLRADVHESPYFAVSARALAARTDSIERKFARARFVHNLQTWGFARLEVTPAQARVPQGAFRAVRAWLAAQLALPPAERWRDYVDATHLPTAADGSPGGLTATHPAVSRGRYVGFSSDRNREYLQLRRPVAKSGMPWPPAYFAENAAFAAQMLELLELLDGVARDCMRAVCDVLNLDERWVLDELLDDLTPAPATAPPDAVRDRSNQYGPSVLRIYNYRNKARPDAAPLHPDDHSCGVHADLGLVTVSPVATVPGLQMWNFDRMAWSDVEEDAQAIHFSVFAGETLGFLTNGLICAPLHRVPAVVVADESSRRMSMPYFLRARPQQVLNPRAAPAAQLTCRDFMEERVFPSRPWRREDTRKDAPPPDY